LLHCSNTKRRRRRQPTVVVVTLTLGSWLRQGLARLRAKREARESRHMLLGV
jgi:hypothetical protein